MLPPRVTPTAAGPFPYQMKKLVMAAAAGLCLAACGSAGLGGSPSPTPSAPPGQGYAVVLTEKDHAATLHVGGRLEVVLRAAAGMTNWSRPRSSDVTVLVAIVDPAATAVRGVTLAAFEARAPGQAVIESAAGPQCSPGQACPMYAIAYMATVTVVS
jgi:hypothetical protein